MSLDKNHKSADSSKSVEKSRQKRIQTDFSFDIDKTLFHIIFDVFMGKVIFGLQILQNLEKIFFLFFIFFSGNKSDTNLWYLWFNSLMYKCSQLPWF